MDVPADLASLKVFNESPICHVIAGGRFARWAMISVGRGFTCFHNFYDTAGMAPVIVRPFSERAQSGVS